MKRFAFTLSEILVTLSIVGVVAILTVPSITKNIYTKTDIATLQSTLKNLGDSVKAMMVNERVTHISDSSLGESTLEGFFNKFLKVSFICDIDDITKCFAPEYKSLDGTVYPLEQDTSFAFQVKDISPIATLPSGASLIYADKDQLFASSNEYFEDVNGNGLYIFMVDVNGPKSPNIIGIDFFTFQIDERGNVGYFAALPADVDEANDLRAVCRSGEDYGLSCAYLLQTDNWDPKVITQKYPDEEVGE